MALIYPEPPPGYEAVFPQSGFNAYAGPIFRKVDGDHFLFTIQAQHLNAGDALHGGMAMAMADVVMGRTVRLAIEPDRAATISLNCDFLAGAKLGDQVIGRAQIARRTRTIVFINSQLSVNDKLILTASGIWKIVTQSEA
ncbi:MAG TPA: thioesterase [Alphaproteobacteria bacterium]|nr:thioesterase [Alphaproteobacteria bacterium]HAJ46092.1 thioesterase [Alphaproteobacteria bacterium]